MSAPSADTAVSLRERKKQRTRRAISDAATALFARRGFEQTTIADVAEAADVARMTVTNYFPLKEDLVFDRAAAIIRLLADAVADRPAGRTPTDAVRAAYLAALARRDPILGFVGIRFAHLVGSSAALQVREREMFVEQEAALAAGLEAECARSPADIRPRLAAAQLAGVWRILYFEGRRRLLAGADEAAIVRALRRAARTGFDFADRAAPDLSRRGGARRT